MNSRQKVAGVLILRCADEPPERFNLHEYELATRRPLPMRPIARPAPELRAWPQTNVAGGVRQVVIVPRSN